MSASNSPHGSLSDLSKLSQAEVLTLRKRKHGEDFSDALNGVSDKIMDTLSKWKLDFDSQLAQVNDNISNVHKDIANFTVTTQEIKADLKRTHDEYSRMKTLVQQLDTQNKEVKKDLNTLKDSVKSSCDKYDELKQKNSELSKDFKNINVFEKELQDLKTQNKKLVSEINNNNQRERLLNIEFVGVPENPDEDLCTLIVNYARKVGIEISFNDIQCVNRVTPRIKVHGRPRVIIAKMATRLIKDNIISGARKFRPNTNDLGISGDRIPIFVNEHLTVANKELLKQTKEMAKLKQFQFAWSKNGRVYVRKNDTSHAILIKDEEELKKLN